MSLIDKINEEFKKAIALKDELKVSTLRMLKAGIQNMEIELRAKRKELNDESVLGVVGREVKRRKESIEAFVKGLRQDLADKERKELEILLIHGLLHLLGYDHEKNKDALKMRKLEKKLLNKV